MLLAQLPPARIALAGNPNVGKSTLFNALTGLRQHTGNWPGKTVSSAEGTFTYCRRSYNIVDLPGTYSLQPMSAEEEVTRAYRALAKKYHPDLNPGDEKAAKRMEEMMKKFAEMNKDGDAAPPPMGWAVPEGAEAFGQARKDLDWIDANKRKQ